MALRTKTRNLPVGFSLLTVLLVTLLDTSAAVADRRPPTRQFRTQGRSPNGRSPLSQNAGVRTVRRFRPVSNPGESTRRVNYAPLRPAARNEDTKQRASESVHVVSLPSMKAEGNSQPAYQAAATKLKIPENDYISEPKDVSARVVSSQSVLVTWVDPEYEKSPKIASDRQYTIRYREKGESARWEYKQINTRRALIDKLNPDGMYEISVRISQGEQEGQWSSSIFQRTPESAPTNAPENLYVETVNGKSNAVSVTWDELSDSAGKIKEYIISYAPAMKPFGGKSVTYSGTTTSAVIDGLQPGERYIFKIRAANRRGQGPQSKAYTVIMPEASSATKNLYQKSPSKAVTTESSEEMVDLIPKYNYKRPYEKTGKIQSTEETDDNEPTPSPSKLSTPVPRRRFHPSLNGQSNSPTARRPFRTNPLNSGRRIIARKPIPPSIIKGDENETKNSETDGSDINTTVEDSRSKDSDTINESKETEREQEEYEDLRNTNPKTGSSVSEAEDLPVHELEKVKSSPTVPSSNEFNEDKNSLSGNSRSSSVAKLPTKHKTKQMTSFSTNTKESEEKPKSEQSVPSVSTNENENPESETEEEENHKHEREEKPKSRPPLQSHRKPTHRFPIAAISQTQPKQLPSTNVGHRQSHSTESTHSAHQDLDSPAENKDKYSGLHESTVERLKKLSRLPVRSNTRATSTTTLPPTPKTTTTIATTTTTTTTTTAATTTTTTTTTTKAQTTPRSYNPNKTADKPTVPSFSGKSALDMLQYYRRKSSQVGTNLGRRIIPNRNLRLQPAETTTVPTTTVMSTTLPPETSKSYNQVQVPISQEEPYTDLTEESTKSSLHDKKLHQEMHSKHPKEKHIPPSKKSNNKKPSLPTSDSSKNKKDMTIPKANINKKSEQPKATDRNSYNVRNSEEDHEDQSEEQKIMPGANQKQNAKLQQPLKTVPSSRSSSAASVPHGKATNSRDKLNNIVPSESPSNKNVEASRIRGKQGSSKDSFALTDDNSYREDNDKAKMLHSDKQSLPLSRIDSKTPKKTQLDDERKFKKPQKPALTTEAPPKLVTSVPKSEFSSSETRSVYSNAAKQSVPEKEENPTPPIRSRLSSYSNVRYLKNRLNTGNNVNRRYPENSRFSPRQSTNLEDEDELSAPETVRDPGSRTSRVSNSYINSRQSGRRTTTPVPTTSQPQTSRTPYRLLPSLSRHRSYFRTTPVPTTTTTPVPTTTTTPVPTTTPRTAAPTYPSSLLRQRMLNSRLGSPLRRQFARPNYRQGTNGRQDETRTGSNTPSSSSNANTGGQRMIFGPGGTKWIIDLNRGLVLNPEGRFLQDSQGKPLRIKMGGDGRTIVDMNGTPVVSPDGVPLFGHGRSSKPVASPQDRPVMSLGGRPLRGLEVARTTRTPTTRMTTTPSTTTTIPTTTTTTTTTPEPTTAEPTTEEPLEPTCAPGTYAQYDEEGNLIMGPDNMPDCYSEDSYSGQDLMATTEAFEEGFEIVETTHRPLQTTARTTTTTTEPPIFYDDSELKSFDNNLVSEFDAAGKKRFTAPYVAYISKDPNMPCSLTDALEHFQVENLADLIPTDIKEDVLPPQNISYNITVVAVEGCHSFVILDWAKPKKGDFITGYLVYSASYDDFLRNKWSTKIAGGTNVPVENLKPNTRYYFKIQAKNPHGLGPVSPSVTFVTESDNPLLIVRPPGGEPIWIPFSFKHDSSYTACHGKQYVKRTWYRKFVGVMLCNSLRYKIFLSENLRDTFYSIGDTWGRGEDHCQFVDSYMEGRTEPDYQILPPVKGYYRHYTQEPVTFGQIGYGTPHNYVGWYECGVPIPGKW